jgi:outer membrane lipoprotein-sorting protein
MKMTIIAAALATTFLAAPAFADCAEDFTKVEEAMKTVKLDEANTTKAKELMDKATVARDAKDEAACTTNTKEVLTLLGM